MHCKNCGKKLANDEKFCTNCGANVQSENHLTGVNKFNQNIKNSALTNINTPNKKDTKKKTNDIKSAFITSIILFVLFVIAATILMLFFYLYYKDNSGMEGLFVLIGLALSILPILVSIILSIVSFVCYKKCNTAEIKRKNQMFKIANLFQIPIIIVILLVGLNFKDNNRKNIVNEKLLTLYDDNYEVIKTCSHSDSGGSNYEIVALKLKNFQIPIIAEFDWTDDSYDDNYAELKEMNELDYQTYINNAFKGNTIAIMEVKRNDKYNTKQVHLNVLITENQIIDNETLKNNIKQIVEKYFYIFSDYDFFFQLDVINEIDENNMEQYYLFLSEGKQNCSGELNDNLELSSETGISFLIDKESNIDAIINNDVDIFLNENNKK